MSHPKQIGIFGVILYDASCGICREVILNNKPFLNRYGFTVVPLQEEWAQELAGRSMAELLISLHLVKPNGEVLQGPNALRYVCKKIWWLSPFYLFSVLPGIRSLTDLLYKYVAANRSGLSKVCRLSVK